MSPASDRPASDAPHYRYDPNYGDLQAAYTPIDISGSPGHRPELAGCFVAYVEGETFISTMHGQKPVAWRAEPGTPCMILGRYSDGTVHVKWPAIAEHYMVDGRFPSWVIAEDPSARLAGGGRVLPAHSPPPERTPFPTRLVAAIVVCVLVIVAAVVVISQFGR